MFLELALCGGIAWLLATGKVTDARSAAKLAGSYFGRASGVATRVRMQADRMLTAAAETNPEFKASSAALQEKLAHLRALSTETKSAVSFRNFIATHAAGGAGAGSSTSAAGFPPVHAASAASSSSSPASFQGPAGSGVPSRGLPQASSASNSLPHYSQFPGRQPYIASSARPSSSSSSMQSSASGGPGVPVASWSSSSSSSAAAAAGGMGGAPGSVVTGSSIAEACMEREALYRQFIKNHQQR